MNRKRPLTSSGYIEHEDQWRILLSCEYIRRKYRTTRGTREYLSISGPSVRRERYQYQNDRQSFRVAVRVNGAMNVRSSFFAVSRSMC
jgi:hypothetical protein